MQLDPVPRRSLRQGDGPESVTSENAIYDFGDPLLSSKPRNPLPPADDSLKEVKLKTNVDLKRLKNNIFVRASKGLGSLYQRNSRRPTWNDYNDHEEEIYTKKFGKLPEKFEDLQSHFMQFKDKIYNHNELTLVCKKDVREGFHTYENYLDSILTDAHEHLNNAVSACKENRREAGTQLFKMAERLENMHYLHRNYFKYDAPHNAVNDKLIHPHHQLLIAALNIQAAAARDLGTFFSIGRGRFGR